MARELEIVVTANTTQAAQALGKLEDSLEDVTKTASKTDASVEKLGGATKTAGAATGGMSVSMDALTSTVMRFASAAAIGAAIDRSIQFGSAVADLSAKTGVSTDTLQSLGFVAAQTGSSMEAMAKAVTFLDKSLEAGGTKTVTVVQGLGLSVDALLALAPEDRFREVASAIGSLSSASEQAYAATALFGRAGADLIPMFKEMANGAEDMSVVMSQEVITNLDEAGDAMNYVTTAATSLLGTFVAVGVETGKLLAEPFILVRDLLSDVNTEMADMAGQLPKIGPAALNLGGLPSVEVNDFNAASKALDEQRKSMTAARRETDAYTQSIMALRDELSGDGAVREVQKLQAAFKALTPEQQDNERIVKQVLDRYTKLRVAAGDEAAPALERLFQATGTLTSKSIDLTRALVPLKAAVEQVGLGELEPLVGKANMTFATFAKTVQAESPKMARSFSGVTGAIQNLPQTIIGALQGGGNALKSVGASLGSGLASDLASNLGSKLPGLFGSALSMAAGPLGSIVGSLAGSLVGKLFGPSQQQQVTDLRNKFLEAGGGLEAMRTRAEAAGVSMDGLFNVRRPQDFDAAVKAFNLQLQASEQRTNDTRAAMEKWGLTIADMGPKFATQEINGKLLSIIKDMELLTAAGADFNLVAEKMAPEINKLLAASMTAGTEVPKELEPIMRKMFDLGLLTDTSGEKLEDFGAINFATDINEQFERLIDKLDDVLDRWLGIEDTIDRSTQAVTDFRDESGLITPPSFFGSPGEPGGSIAQDMLAVGDAVAGVNKQLALSENHMRNVRSAMRQWNLSLKDMGGTFAAQELDTQLQDILGDMELLTASGADFATVAKAMGPSIGNLLVEASKAGQSVPQELEPLLRQMYDLGVFVDRQGRAIEGLGNVQFSSTAQADLAALIARIAQNLSTTDPFAVTGMDAGGVAGQTLRMPSSRDTIPALLRPGELVLTPEQQRAAGLGGGTTSISVAINVAGYLDSPSARTGLADVVRDELAKTLRRTGRAA
jgi:hypothetical protein